MTKSSVSHCHTNSTSSKEEFASLCADLFSIEIEQAEQLIDSSKKDAAAQHLAGELAQQSSVANQQ